MKKKEHPVTWEQIWVAVRALLVLGVLVLAGWKACEIVWSPVGDDETQWDCYSSWFFGQEKSVVTCESKSGTVFTAKDWEVTSD